MPTQPRHLEAPAAGDPDTAPTRWTVVIENGTWSAHGHTSTAIPPIDERVFATLQEKADRVEELLNQRGQDGAEES